MHPALILLSISQMVLAFLIPALLGLLTYRSGASARAWFAAGVGYAFYIALTAAFPSKEFSSIRLIQIVMLYSYIFSLGYLLLKELKEHQTAILPVAIATAFILIHASVSYAQSLLVEQVVQSAFVILSDTIIAILAILLAIRGSEKGFALVAASGLLVASSNALRAEELLLGSGTFNLADFTWKTNFLVVGHLVGIVFVNIGYAGVVISRTAKREAAAEAGLRAAEDSNQRMQDLLEERDHMVMINSQFATVSGMSVLTGAIVHEITQPIQALVVAVDHAKSDAKHDPVSSDCLKTIEALAIDCMTIVQSLRVIMSRGRPDTQLIEPCQTMSEVIPIIQGECERRDITFTTSFCRGETRCMVDPVLFKRVLLNLSSNAIEAISHGPVKNPKVSVSVRTDGSCVFVDVSDNSGQDIDIQSLTFETLVSSRKPTGMGLGLMLCSKIANSWQGKLTVKRETAGADTVSTFTLELPLTSP